MNFLKLVFILIKVISSQDLVLRNTDGSGGLYEYLFHKNLTYTTLGSLSYQVAIDYCEAEFEGTILKCDSLSEWNFVFNFFQQNSLDFMFYGIEIPSGYDHTHSQWHDGTLINPSSLNLVVSNLPAGPVTETLPFHVHLNGGTDPEPIAEGIICKKFVGYRLMNSGIIGSNETVLIDMHYAASLIDCGALCLKYTRENARVCIEFGLISNANRCWLKLSKVLKVQNTTNSGHFMKY